MIPDVAADPEAFPILFRDRHLVVIDKPAGIPVAPTRQGDGSIRTRTGLYLCHRLDVETSGCLVMARSAAGHRVLSVAFAEGRVQKTYLAVVRIAEGQAIAETGESRVPIGAWQRGRVQIGTGKAAHTQWRLRWRHGARAGLEVTPFTGRTHQIRAHLAQAGLPIEGDPTYGGPSGERVLLHAWKVRIPWPDAQTGTSIESPIPLLFRDPTEAAPAR